MLVANEKYIAVGSFHGTHKHVLRRIQTLEETAQPTKNLIAKVRGRPEGETANLDDNSRSKNMPLFLPSVGSLGSSVDGTARSPNKKQEFHSMAVTTGLHSSHFKKIKPLLKLD